MAKARGRAEQEMDMGEKNKRYDERKSGGGGETEKTAVGDARI